MCSLGNTQLQFLQCSMTVDTSCVCQYFSILLFNSILALEAQLFIYIPCLLWLWPILLA
jgi:hypothetical protein